jgi:transcriptional regulator with XRE-family HTH domain
MKNDELKNAAVCLEFGRRLRQLQIRRAMTLPELAAAAKLTDDYTRRLISGLQEPRIATVIALAAALDVEPGELLKPVERMKVKDRLASAVAIVEKLHAVKEAR